MVRGSAAEAMTDFVLHPPQPAAEAAGYSSMTIPDSIACPSNPTQRLPYTPDGNHANSGRQTFHRNLCPDSSGRSHDEAAVPNLRPQTAIAHKYGGKAGPVPSR